MLCVFRWKQCTVDSGTDGATGSTAITACLCNAGYTGAIALPADTCAACLANTFKAVVGPAVCTECPPDSSHPETGATEITVCTCDEGFTGSIEDESSVCDVQGLSDGAVTAIVASAVVGGIAVMGTGVAFAQGAMCFGGGSDQAYKAASDVLTEPLTRG